jgi:hypothetical protein
MLQIHLVLKSDINKKFEDQHCIRQLQKCCLKGHSHEKTLPKKHQGKYLGPQIETDLKIFWSSIKKLWIFINTFCLCGHPHSNFTPARGMLWAWDCFEEAKGWQNVLDILRNDQKILKMYSCIKLRRNTWPVPHLQTWGVKYIPQTFSAWTNRSEENVSYFLAIRYFVGHFAHKFVNLGLKDWGLGYFCYTYFYHENPFKNKVYISAVVFMIRVLPCLV